MLQGLPTVFISCSERYRDTVAAPFKEWVDSLGLLGVIVSLAPMPLDIESTPTSKVDFYLRYSDMFVALVTPDNEMADGSWTSRPNIADEVARAQKLPHLERKIMVFKHRDVAIWSNINPLYDGLDAEDMSSAYSVFEAQAIEWQILKAEDTHTQSAPPAVSGTSAIAGPIHATAGNGEHEAVAALRELAAGLQAEEIRGADLEPQRVLRAHVAATAAYALHDESVLLGATEANELVIAAPRATLQAHEQQLLFRSVLAGLKNRNQPGWALLDPRSREDWHRDLCAAAFDRTSGGVQLAAAELLASAPWLSPRHSLVLVAKPCLENDWLPLRDAGHNLVAAHGDEQTLIDLRLSPETEDSDSAARARAFVGLRTDASAAVELVAERPAVLSPELRSALAVSGRRVSDKALKRLLTHEAIALRQVGVQVGASTRRIGKAQAIDIMVGDPSSQVRGAALDVALRRRWKITLDQIRAALKADETPMFGLRARHELSVRAYQSQPDDLLEPLADGWAGESYYAYSALALKSWEARAERVRADLADNFEAQQERFINHLRDGIETALTQVHEGDEPRHVDERTISALLAKRVEMWEFDGDLGAYVRDRFTVEALRALAMHGEADDADIARQHLASKDADVREQAAYALLRTGNADDVDALIAAATHVSDETRNAAVAAAVFLAANEQDVLERILAADNPAVVRGALTAMGPRAPLQSLFRLLYHDHYFLREDAAALCIKRLDRKTLQGLMTRYPRRGGTYYYNVIVALDHAIYAPRWLRPALSL